MTWLRPRIPPLEDFAALLVASRKKVSLTQTELAAAAGLTPSYLSFIENRKKPPPSDEVCRRLADALDLAPETLLERAHLQRAPKELRAKVHSLTSSLHRERLSLRQFLQDMLSPFLFSGPPGYADSAMDTLALSPAKRRRIREAALRDRHDRVGREAEVRKFVEELSDDELQDLAERVPRLIEDQGRSEPPLLATLPPADDPRAEHPFLLDLTADQLGSLATPTAGDRALIDPGALPEPDDYLLLREPPAGVVRHLRVEDERFRLEGGPGGAEELGPATELVRQFEAILVGVIIEVRTVLRRRPQLGG